MPRILPSDGRGSKEKLTGSKSGLPVCPKTGSKLNYDLATTYLLVRTTLEMVCDRIGHFYSVLFWPCIFCLEGVVSLTDEEIVKMVNLVAQICRVRDLVKMAKTYLYEGKTEEAKYYIQIALKELD